MALPEMLLETALGLQRHKPITNHVKGSIQITSMQNIPIPAQNQHKLEQKTHEAVA